MKCFPVQDCTPKKKGKLIFTFQRSGLLWKCDHCRCAACCLLSRKLVFWPWQVECVNIYEQKCYMSRRVSRNEEELRSTLSHLMSVIKRVCIWLKQFENSLFSARFWRTKEALSFLKFQFETFCPPLSIILRNERTNRPASHQVTERQVQMNEQKRKRTNERTNERACVSANQRTTHRPTKWTNEQACD